MGFNDILKSLFGNKSDRDLKELLPIASKVNAEWEKMDFRSPCGRIIRYGGWRKLICLIMNLQKKRFMAL